MVNVDVTERCRPAKREKRCNHRLIHIELTRSRSQSEVEETSSMSITVFPEKDSTGQQLSNPTATVTKLPTVVARVAVQC